ncbi:MAG: protoglobin domain-containing protein [Planctomycetota bacterium]
MVSFGELQEYMGLGDADVRAIRGLAGEARQVLPAVIEQFYQRLLNYAEARQVLEANRSSLDALRGTLRGWLEEVFNETPDDAYVEKRFQIGRTHVRVGLPPRLMVSGMELIWQSLEERLGGAGASAERRSALNSVHKILMLDLAVMLESYQESYAEQVRRSERSAVEEKLTRAEHLAEIGQLAASLAHEIKNPLAGISGAIQVFRDTMPHNNPHRPILTEILGQINRLDATVKDLLLYARPLPPKSAKFMLGDVVTRVLSVLREEPALQRVRIECEAAVNSGQIVGDDGQLEHLVINLILNAAQASRDGGVVQVKVDGAKEWVRLLVRDDGVGMAKDVRERAFEPFFTTKSKGTGLGLSICRRIVDAHGGSIRLDSELGRGTTVTVDLPSGPRSGGAKTLP